MMRFDPFSQFEELSKKLEFLNRALLENENAAAVGDVDFIPTVNTRETDKSYLIEVDLPGVKKSDINIDVNDNILRISGSRTQSKEREDDEYYRVESRYGKFERSFTLPEDVDANKISAKSKDGVLSVVIPKAAVVQKAPKKIEIK